MTDGLFSTTINDIFGPIPTNSYSGLNASASSLNDIPMQTGQSDFSVPALAVPVLITPQSNPSIVGNGILWILIAIGVAWYALR